MARVFAVMVQILLGDGAVAVQIYLRPLLSHGAEIWSKTVAQRSRYKLSRRQKFITVQDFNCVQMRVSGCMIYNKSVKVAGAKQKP
jgi:hypothetical protein